MPGRIVIGTSSWADPGFVAEWYSAGLPARDRLPWYASRFEGVEVGERADGLAGQAEEVRLMFNDNRGDDAPMAAQRLRELLGQVQEGVPA